jgi:hypothetical protein
MPDWRNRRCDTCDVWQRLADDSGECRINPPVDGSVKFGGRWPLTLPDQFCGCWRPLPVVQGSRPPLPARSPEALPVVEVDYQNHRGERRWRRVRVAAVYFGTALPYHPEPQCLLEVLDVERQLMRTFTLAGCLGWRAAEGGGA